MTAYNSVRFRVKAGMEDAFLKSFASTGPFVGMRKGAVIKTGERSYCSIAEWDSFEALIAARPAMIASLDGFRHTLEDLGGGLGVTDPVSGEVVLEVTG